MPAADCHFHVFDPARFAYRNDVIYTPHPSQAGTADNVLALFDTHGITHGLAVGGAPYGSDNRCLLDGIARSKGRLKGIALVEHDVSGKEIAQLIDGGIVGVRINLHNQGLAPLTDARAPALLAKLKDANWFCQIQCEKDQIADAMPILQKAGVRVMIDHCGRVDPLTGPASRGFKALLELGRSGMGVMKISGPFRFSRLPYPHPDTDAIVHQLIEAFTPDNCVWGSDWPFVRLDMRVDYGPTRAVFDRWVPDAKVRQKILWDTPARLFGFN
jgi:predicted TIM-barrel fold metal-dependent hydrolase